MGKKINSNSGFTLIELLVGLAISCIVLVAAYSFVLTGINSYDRTKKTIDIQQETQFIENLIVDAVENGHWMSSDIDKDSINRTLKFDTGEQVLYYYEDDTTLVLYDKGTFPSPPPASADEQHIVSKKVTRFSVKYINDEAETETETDTAGNKNKVYIKDAEGKPIYNEDVTGSTKTKLVKVEVDVAMNGKTDSSAKQYKFRNE